MLCKFAIASELLPPLTAKGSSTNCNPMKVAGSTGGNETTLSVLSILIGSFAFVILKFASTVGIISFT